MRSIQVADTVVFKPQYITIPTVLKIDAIVAVANELTQVLKDKTVTNIKQLMQLVDIFKAVATKMSEPETDKPSKHFENPATQTRVTNTSVENKTQ